MYAQVLDSLLAPAGVGEKELELALGRLVSSQIDFGELYFQRRVSEGWMLEDGAVKSGSFDSDQGVGVRAVAGAGTGFAYADSMALPALMDAAGSARAIARAGGNGMVRVGQPRSAPTRYGSHDPVGSGESSERVELLRTIDAYVRSLDSRISQVSVNLSASHESILVAATDGVLAGDVRPLVRLDIRVLMEEDGRREQGFSGGGGRWGLASVSDPDFWQEHAREAVRIAAVNLGAEPAPAGHMTVVLGSGWPGVLLHEAVGHGLEGDFNRKGISAFADRMGEMVATEACTVVDDGTLDDRRGSLSIDDEGTPSACNTLIENGRLVGYMQDRLNARLMGGKPTGNGRRESFAHLPMPRMTNTYMLPGEHDPGEILASVDDGIYAVGFNGGQVDITSGKFVFAASEAYRVRNGKVGAPIKGATLIGNGPDVLTRVGMVGNDLALDSGVGICGKEGQSVPVGVGQPTLRIDGLTVGGDGMSRGQSIDTDNTALLHDPDRETELLVGIAQRVLERAKAGGADEAEVSLGSSLGREATVRLAEIETLEEARDRSVQVTVYMRQCTGSASTGDLRPQAIDETVERALAIARNTQPDRAAGLADAASMATEFPDLDLWHPEDIALDDLVARALDIERSGRDADGRIANSEGASVTTEANLAVYANSHGFVGRMRGTAYSQSCVLIARDENGMQRDYDFDTQRRFADLASPESTGQGAARRTARRLGAKRIRTGRMPVLFAPEVARGLIGHLVSAVSGGNLYRRSSFLLDAAGERVMPDWASLVERPHLPRGARSAAFDADGMATRESPLVDSGVLSRYVLSSYSARRLGLAPTANAGGVHNLELSGATHSFEELLAAMGEGLVVTELMGQGVNLVTGDYSRGAAGFRVEDGRLGAPVEEITIAGNLREMYLGLVAAGTDVDARHNIRTGSLLVGEMTVAGQED